MFFFLLPFAPADFLARFTVCQLFTRNGKCLHSHPKLGVKRTLTLEHIFVVWQKTHISSHFLFTETFEASPTKETGLSFQESFKVLMNISVDTRCLGNHKDNPVTLFATTTERRSSVVDASRPNSPNSCVSVYFCICK